MPGRNVANNQALLTSHMAQNSALNSMEIFVNILTKYHESHFIQHFNFYFFI